MLFQIKTINGQKTIVPLTADTGTGAPVGSFVYMYKKSSPSGYLYCDGSTFDETKYPALYQYLGSNVLPDYRECVAVGAEQNTTDTIASHDVYTEGQFKDDQLQNITGTFRGLGYSDGAFGDLGHVIDTVPTTGGSGIYENMKFDASRVARTGTTTHGKQKAVYFYIKATSGLTENQQENVLNTINENLSYSTTEHKTGKKWIDGKDIYSKVVDCGALPNTTSKTVSAGLTNENVIKMKGVGISNSYNIPIPYDNSLTLYYNNTSHSVVITATSDRSSYTQSYITLEYTKTTDN